MSPELNPPVNPAAAGALAFELAMPPLGAWREGNVGVEGVWRFAGAREGRSVLVTALVHGNELCGAWAVLEALQAGLRPRAGTLTLALCNLAAFDRFDPQAPHASRFVDEDLNRVWGDSLAPESPASESHKPESHKSDSHKPESQERRRARQLQPFVEAADWLLDLHSMHEPGAPLLLSGPHRRNRDLAKALGSPEHVIVDSGHADGRRMRDHGRFGAAVDDGSRSLLIECGYHGALSSRSVALDMLGRFLVQAGTVREAELPAGWRQPSPARQQLLEVTHAVVAATPDLRFAGDWRSGQVIEQEGTVLGWDGDVTLRTPYPRCVLVMPSLRQLRVGVTVMRLARPLVSGPLGT